MTKRVRQAIDNVLSSEDGAIFTAFLLTKAGVFEPQKDADKIAVQQFFISLLGDMDLYTTRGDFQLRFVKTLKSLPRSEGWNRETNKDGIDE